MGVKIPETMTDDMPDDETLPYMEMLYKFVYGKKSHYDLTMTRHVEPQAGERSELGGVTTTPDEDIAQAVQVLNRCGMERGDPWSNSALFCTEVST